MSFLLARFQSNIFFLPKLEISKFEKKTFIFTRIMAKQNKYFISLN